MSDRPGANFFAKGQSESSEEIKKLILLFKMFFVYEI